MHVLMPIHMCVSIYRVSHTCIYFYICICLYIQIYYSSYSNPTVHHRINSVFPISISLILFSNSKKPGFLYLQYIYLFDHFQNTQKAVSELLTSPSVEKKSTYRFVFSLLSNYQPGTVVLNKEQFYPQRDIWQYMDTFWLL